MKSFPFSASTRILAGLSLLMFAGGLHAAEATTGPLNFTFIHASDTHIDTFFSLPDSFENARSWKAVRTLQGIGALRMQPYNYTAHKPEFIIHTGDICEFGSAGKTPEVVDRYFADLGLPVYYILGNHDGTWAPPYEWMKKRFGGNDYSFDHLGVHFIGLDSPGVQDPRPSFGQETITFLQKDLAKVSRTTPIIVFTHHPIPGTEFASRYDYDRVLDLLERYNLMLIMDGHGHNAVHRRYNNMDFVMGGSTFSKAGKDINDGYNVVSLDGEKLRVAYRRAEDAEATKPMVEKPIPQQSLHPDVAVTVTQTGEGANRQVVLQGTVKQAAYAIASQGLYSVDDELTGTMQVTGNQATVTIPADKLEAGVHFARLTFKTGEKDVEYDKSMAFAVEHGPAGGKPVAAWRYQLQGGSRTRPLVNGGKVYVGGNDGVLCALDATTGKLQWAVDSGSMITAGPAVYKDLVIYGTGDGYLRAVTENGQARWSFPTGTAVMGHPLVHEGMIYFASTGATMYCLDAQTGQKKWEFAEARFQVETKPVIAGDKLLFGAWDGNLYCLEAATGKKLWSEKGPRNMTQSSIPQYYGPADAPVVVIGDKVIAADRANKSGSYTLDGKFIKEGPESAVAFGAAADGKHVYLRRGGSGVAKLDTDLNIVWESDVKAGHLPLEPVEADGVVYGVTATGTLYALDSESGRTLWNYRVSPKLYVHTAPTIANGLVYTVGEDGVVTAVRIPGKNQN